MEKKYIHHVTKDHLVGLLHQRENLFALLMEAKYLNRIAIISPLHLNGKHNNGQSIKCTWDRYIVLDSLKAFHPFVTLADFGHIDFDNCVLVDENTKPADIINFDDSLIVRKHRRYPNYYKLIRHFSHNNWGKTLISFLEPSEQVSKYSILAIKKMKDYHCLHIRRGDKLGLKQCPGLDRKTQPNYLNNFLLKIIPKGEKLYIMSNEKKRDYFKPLKESFTIFTYHDFPQFESISKIDNYLLFSIENEIMTNANTKIRTFKEDGFLSILNYPANGVELLSSKIKRRLVFILRKLNLK